MIQVYDRYGNRTQQNALQSGPSPLYLFNTSNNQITGFTYDAAGNLMTDGVHNYQYDAEGNILSWSHTDPLLSRYCPSIGTIRYPAGGSNIRGLGSARLILPTTKFCTADARGSNRFVITLIPN